MHKYLSFAILIATPTIAFAEEDTNWDGTLKISLDPSFEQSSILDLNEDFQNKGEATTKVVIRTPELAAHQRISFTLGSTYSPSRFFDQDEESAAFLEVSVGSTPFNVTRLGQSDIWSKSDIDDHVKFNAFYKYSEEFSGFFGKGGANNETVGINLGYVDVRSIACSQPEKLLVTAREGGACSNIPAVSYTFGIKGQRNWSSKDNSDQDSLSGSAKVTGPIIGDAFRPYGSAEAKYGRFRNLDITGIGSRKDMNYQLAAGFDLGPLVGDDFGLEAGVSQTWANSNLESEDGQEFTATLSLNWNFGLF